MKMSPHVDAETGSTNSLKRALGLMVARFAAAFTLTSRVSIFYILTMQHRMIFTDSETVHTTS